LDNEWLFKTREFAMSESGIFKAAVKLPAEQRATYLDKACGADFELRHEVESLLGAHDASGQFLKERAPNEAMGEHDPVVERPGTVIGPYKLLEQIGEGGFGVVFLAEQQAPIRRKVALKLLKPAMDTKQVVARFEAERQALALMDHPNIAQVLDAGQTSGGSQRPYFVMELVKGVPITEFCDRHHLTPRQRLELFLPVCQAVQHAHQKGIIHRDLKPSNVMVSRHDTTPIVKVIDFGVAKALGQELTDKTLFTGIAQMVGTPLYMSPEQAGASDLDIDTRSDIYSLGFCSTRFLQARRRLPRSGSSRRRTKKFVASSAKRIRPGQARDCPSLAAQTQSMRCHCGPPILTRQLPWHPSPPYAKRSRGH
jgi:serine/threonine protein kinase